MSRANRILWRRWRQERQEDAFEALVQPHLQFVLDYARRIGCSAADADDVVQQSLTRLLQERSDRPVDVGLRAWLGRTVSLQARMLRRTEARRARRERAVATEAPVVTELLEHQDEVEAALAALPETLREAVVLRYLHDLEYREMAHVLGATENACRIRVHRGLETLRDQLARHPEPLLALLPLLGGLPGTDPLRASLATASTTGMAATIAGALAMKKVLVTLSILAVAAVGVLVAARDRGGNGEEAPSRTASPEGRAAKSVRVAEAEPAEEAQPTTAKAAAGATPTPSLVEEILAAGGAVAFAPREKYQQRLAGPGFFPPVRWYRSREGLPEAGLVTGVQIHGKELGDLLARLLDLSSLHWLSVSGSDIDDGALELLVTLPGLDGLHLGRTKVTDEGMRHLGRIASLTVLSLHNTRLTDAGVAHLTNLPRLVYLDIHDLRITDESLKHVGKLTQLAGLRLGQTSITDEGMRHLGRLDRLALLDLSDAGITGAGVEHLNLSRLVSLTCEEAQRIDDSVLKALRGAKALKTLNLEETSVTDAGLAHVAELRSLEWLHLGGTRVTDTGLPHLVPLANLRLLKLEGTAVSDAGIEHLIQLRALRALLLKDTRVTKDGADRLRAALPHCKIKLD